MQISKIFLSVFLVGFLLFGFLYLYNGINYGKKKAVWEADKDRLNISIADHQVKAKFHKKEAKKWMDEANKEASKRREAERQLEDEKVNHARDLARIETLAPDELVIETRQILQVSENQVYLVPDGIVFTLAASRLNLQKLQTLKFTLKIEIPHLHKLLLSKGNEIGNLKGVIIEKDGTISTVEGERDDWKEKFEGEERLRKASESSFNLFSTKNLVIGGVVGVVIVGLLFVLK